MAPTDYAVAPFFMKFSIEGESLLKGGFFKRILYGNLLICEFSLEHHEYYKFLCSLT